MGESGGGQRTTLTKGLKLDRPTAGPKASPGGLAPLWGPLGSYMRGPGNPGYVSTATASARPLWKCHLSPRRKSQVLPLEAPTRLNTPASGVTQSLHVRSPASQRPLPRRPPLPFLCPDVSDRGWGRGASQASSTHGGSTHWQQFRSPLGFRDAGWVPRVARAGNVDSWREMSKARGSLSKHPRGLYGGSSWTRTALHGLWQKWGRHLPCSPACSGPSPRDAAQGPHHQPQVQGFTRTCRAPPSNRTVITASCPWTWPALPEPN